MKETLKALFSEPFGGGYPPSEAKRKIADANHLKELKAKSQINFQQFIEKVDPDIISKVRLKTIF